MNETPAILDVEASGFGKGSYPIEVGVAFPDGRLLARLIRPVEIWIHWNEEAEGVHGIPREKLFDEGVEPKELAIELNHMLESTTVYTDGWGVDRSWLALLFEEAGVIQRFRLESVYSLLNEQQLESWSISKDRVLELTGMVPHRAGTDALLVQRTLLYTLDPDKFEKKPGVNNAA